MKSTVLVLSALFASVTAVRIHDKDNEVEGLPNNAYVNAGSDVEWDTSENERDQDYAQTERDINDADGDGVEDNLHKSQGELDKFRNKVYGPAIEDIHNTINGEMPGHVRKGEDTRPADPVSSAQAAKESVHKPAPMADTATASAVNALDMTSMTGLAQDISAEKLSAVAEGIDIADNWGDNEYLQTESTSQNQKFSFYANTINGPEDLQLLQVGKTKKAWKRRITDADGDGVEDNVKFDHDELDNFYDPLVFGVAEDINNTHHGNLPGHYQHEFTLNNGEPPMHWQEIVQGPWPTK